MRMGYDRGEISAAEWARLKKWEGWCEIECWDLKVRLFPPRDPNEQVLQPGDDDYDPTPTWYEPY